MQIVNLEKNGASRCLHFALRVMVRCNGYDVASDSEVSNVMVEKKEKRASKRKGLGSAKDEKEKIPLASSWNQWLRHPSEICHQFLETPVWPQTKSFEKNSNQLKYFIS